MRTGKSRVLVDWDTVGLAPPERDLWLVLSDDQEEATIYTDATGHEVDQAALDFFRLTWDLKDLATYLDVLRAPHRDNQDTAQALQGVKNCVASRDQWAALLD
jgi:spectinomycin phosphotransferase